MNVNIYGDHLNYNECGYRRYGFRAYSIHVLHAYASALTRASQDGGKHTYVYGLLRWPCMTIVKDEHRRGV